MLAELKAGSVQRMSGKKQKARGAELHSYFLLLWIWSSKDSHLWQVYLTKVFLQLPLYYTGWILHLCRHFVRGRW